MMPPNETDAKYMAPVYPARVASGAAQGCSCRGAYLTTEEGHRVIDSISSWWVITHGHRHPKIVAAIKAQADILDQVIFAEYTHEPAEQLAAKLLTLAPEGLEHVFFSDSGSTSIEVALKAAMGFWRHTGEARHRIVVMEHSYHGDTIGTMSVGARGPFTDAYEPLLFDVERIPFPALGHEDATLDAFEGVCRRGDVAALLVEPLCSVPAGCSCIRRPYSRA